MLKVQNVCKRYGDVDAVSNLCFNAERGKIYGLIGPNGAGKSTTIRMIVNILAPDSGFIEFEGKILTGEDRNRIGYLPEERGLYKKEKLNDVLLYLAALKDCPKSIAQPRIDQWLEHFGLLEWKNKKIDSLSKGMSQKAQFIGTVVHDPEILFLDEPFSGLDPVSADDLLSCIRDMKRQGKLILFSTHVMEQAEKVCDHVVMLHHGKKILDGDLGSIRREYGRGSVSLNIADSDETPDSLITRLLALPGVISVESEERSFSVFLEPGTEPECFFDNLAGKFKVKGFSVNEPSLHSIFVSLASGKGEL